MKREDVISQFITGSAQFRIKESVDENAPVYMYYGQTEMENDLASIKQSIEEGKRMKTFDPVTTVKEGDVLFSLISGKATMVCADHEDYIFTQNYIKLVPGKKLDPKYLVYLLNEDPSIKGQLQRGLQGSVILKYTVKQLKELVLPKLPSLKEQQLMGELYFNQMHIEALHQRVARLETLLVLGKIREATKS